MIMKPFNRSFLAALACGVFLFASPARADEEPEDLSPPTEVAPAPEAEGTLSKEEEKEGEAAAKTHDAAKYAAYIRSILPKVKERALEKIEKKLQASQEAKMATLSTVLGWVSLSGFLLLLMPLFLMKKYPGKFKVLMKSSAIAAFSSVLVLNLFAAVIMLLKNAQGALAHHTNPQLKIVEAAIDGLGDSADQLVEVGPSLIQPTLDQLGSNDGSLPIALLENVKHIAKDVQPFLAAAKWFKSLLWIFEYVPIVMTTIAVFLFAVGAKPMLMELIRLPARAAAGDAPKGVVKEAFKRVGRELLATICLILALVVITLISGELLALAVRPAVRAFLDTFLLDVIYVQTPNASSGLIFASLAGSVLFLALNVLAILVSTGLFLGKAHKIFQQRFQDKVPLREHRAFFGFGLLALVWAQVFPWLFALGAEPVLEKIGETAMAKGEPNWTLILASSPVVLVLGFMVTFWALRALKGLAFIKKYDLVARKAAWQRASERPPPMEMLPA
jgi:hypothetical protein